MFSLSAIFVVISTLFLLTSANHNETGNMSNVFEGLTIPPFQDNIDWVGLKSSSIYFGYLVATVGATDASPMFTEQFSRCQEAGLFCGAYHIPTPQDSGNGVAEARNFVANGEWTANSTTFPGALILGAYDLSPDTCYGLSTSALVKWIHDFSGYYYSQTERYPVISTTYEWWNVCTNNDESFNSTNPLWLVTSTTIPGGWSRYSFLQATSPTLATISGVTFNGNVTSLADFAGGEVDLGGGLNNCTTKGG